jgi:hypothetical protein
LGGVIGLGLVDLSAPQEIRFDVFGGGDEAGSSSFNPAWARGSNILVVS